MFAQGMLLQLVAFHVACTQVARSMALHMGNHKIITESSRVICELAKVREVRVRSIVITVGASAAVSVVHSR